MPYWHTWIKFSNTIHDFKRVYLPFFSIFSHSLL